MINLPISVIRESQDRILAQKQARINALCMEVIKFDFYISRLSRPHGFTDPSYLPDYFGQNRFNLENDHHAQRRIIKSNCMLLVMLHILNEHYLPKYNFGVNGNPTLTNIIKSITFTPSELEEISIEVTKAWGEIARNALNDIEYDNVNDDLFFFKIISNDGMVSRIITGLDKIQQHCQLDNAFKSIVVPDAVNNILQYINLEEIKHNVERAFEIVDFSWIKHDEAVVQLTKEQYTLLFP